MARELEQCTQDCAETARLVVHARRRALNAEPIARPPAGDSAVPLPPRERALIEAIDQFVTLSDPADPELASLKFLAGATSLRWRQPDGVGRVEEVLRTGRADPTAEYAANLVLDALVHAKRIVEARAWVDVLRADAPFLADKPDLRHVLELLDAKLPR